MKSVVSGVIGVGNVENDLLVDGSVAKDELEVLRGRIPQLPVEAHLGRAHHLEQIVAHKVVEFVLGLPLLADLAQQPRAVGWLVALRVAAAEAREPLDLAQPVALARGVPVRVSRARVVRDEDPVQRAWEI